MAKFILSPGPTQCKPQFMDILSEPLIYHRCSDFHKLYDSTRNYLRQIINIDGGEIFLLASSGTGAMEASVANFCSPGDHVLVISVGNFGNRFAQICEAFNLNIDVLSYPIGKSYDLGQVSKFIKSNTDLKAVFLTHHETSSGVLNKIEPVGELVAELDDCVFIVDSISGLLAHPMEMSNWHIDCMLAASQKGFSIPPGLAIAALSDKALKLLDRSTSPRFYFDFRLYKNMLKIQETPFTPNISLIIAINKACKYILEDIGLDNYYAHHLDLRLYLEDQLRQRGFDVDFIQECDRGNVLVAVNVKPGWNAIDIHDALDENGYIVATGFGDLKPKMLRIAVIGDVAKDNLDHFLKVFDNTIEELYG